MRKIAAIAALTGLILIPVGVALAQTAGQPQQPQQPGSTAGQPGQPAAQTQPGAPQAQASLPSLEDTAMQAGTPKTLTGRLVDVIDFVVLQSYGAKGAELRDKYRQRLGIPEENFTTSNKPGQSSDASKSSQASDPSKISPASDPSKISPASDASKSPSGQSSPSAQTAQSNQPDQPGQPQPGQASSTQKKPGLGMAITELPKSLDQLRLIGFVEEQSWAQKVFTGRDNYLVIFDPAITAERATAEKQILPNLNGRVTISGVAYEREGFKVLRVKSVQPAEEKEIGSAK